MSILKRGIIIDANLDPTKGSETGKTRPCIIVTNNIYNFNERVPIIQIVPITESSAKKARIITNVEIEPSSQNGLTKKSIADCLQACRADRRFRLVNIRGELEPDVIRKIDKALKIVFGLS